MAIHQALTLSLLVILLSSIPVTSFAVVTMSGSGSKEIYGIPKSGWMSPDWKWGSAMGTGHDCAAISRQRYSTVKARRELVEGLVEGGDKSPPFEEVKLVLALAWQKGRRSGSDGGKGGYGDVLATMADAQRYEVGDKDECSRLLVNDMQERFELLDPSAKDMTLMSAQSKEADVDVAKRRCAGLVLKAMGFIADG